VAQQHETTLITHDGIHLHRFRSSLTFIFYSYRELTTCKYRSLVSFLWFLQQAHSNRDYINLRKICKKHGRYQL